jgi:hypothetical protein
VVEKLLKIEKRASNGEQKNTFVKDWRILVVLSYPLLANHKMVWATRRRPQDIVIVFATSTRLSDFYRL